MPGEDLPLVEDLRAAVREWTASGESLNELGRRSGVSAAQLSRFLSGGRTLTLPATARLCEFLRLRLVRGGAPGPRPRRRAGGGKR
jgi:transcriptional regulator with XRE-family HTH domain